MKYTMVFFKSGIGREEYMDRYETYEQALAGHKKAVMMVEEWENDKTKKNNLHRL